MSFHNDNFKSNPNFKYKGNAVEKTECLASTYQFDVFRDDKGEVYLISPYWDISKADKLDHHISLINLKNNQVEKTLEGHKDRVLVARYFQDPYTKKHYFISADRKFHVLVWDLSNNGNIIFDEFVKYDSFIYSVLLMFDENGTIYAVISTLGSGETWVYPINDKAKKKALKNSKESNVYFLTYWWDKKIKHHNIISCGKNTISIHDFNTDENPKEFKTDDKHPYNLGGMVFEKEEKNFLITSATYGLIKLIDLDEKKEVFTRTFEDVFLYSFVRWNDQYILINDCMQRRILVLDMKDDYKIKSKVLCPEMYFDRFIQKVDHPIHGESLLSVGIDWNIKIFANRNIRRQIESEKAEENK